MTTTKKIPQNNNRNNNKNNEKTVSHNAKYHNHKPMVQNKSQSHYESN